MVDSPDWQTAEYHEDQQDQQHESQATAGAVAPIAAMRPGWDGTEKHQDQQDEKNGSEWHDCRLS